MWPSLLLAVSLLGSAASGSDFLGCGGSLRPSSGLLRVDLSRVSVGLFTRPHGSLKETTDIAPNNGDFFLPIYDKGAYTLKIIAPEGWKIAPEGIDLDIDGETDACSRGEDVKFVLEGFAVTGAVRNKDSQSGPDGIAVLLLGKGGVEREARTGTGGGFIFEGVVPGEYEVAVSKAARDSFSFEKTAAAVNVADGTVAVAPFVIQGYEIEGRVSDGQGGGVQGIKVVLTMDGKKPRTETTATDGSYHFPKVTSGDYELEAVGGADLTLSPAKQAIQVFDRNMKVADVTLESFVLRGSVLDAPKGKPLDKAAVSATVGGSAVQVASKGSGKFEISGVQMGQEVAVKVSASDFLFQETKVTVKSITSEPLEISPWKYAVSGSVERGSGLLVECTVNGAKVKSAVSDEGRFQTLLPGGEHACSVVNADGGGAAKGYTPLRHTVKPKDKAVSGVDFILAKLTVSGSVSAFPGSARARVGVRSPATGMTDSVEVDGSGKFRFKDLLPGVYAFTVSVDGACWEEETLEREIIDDKADVTFKQKGFKVTVSAPHPTTLVTTLKGAKEEHSLERGSNSICLAGTGSDSVALSVRDCKTFSFTPADAITPSKDRSVVLTLTGVNVPIEIESASGPLEALQVRVKRNGERSVLKTPKTKTAKWLHTLVAMEGDELHVEPVSEEDFFTPPSLHLEVKNDCTSNAMKFASKAGVFVEGAVAPAVEGAAVSFVNKEFSEMEALTDAKGRFRLGPLEEAASPNEELSVYKDNYNFVAIDGKPGQFKSFKLASVAVKVVNEATGKPLQNVVVSLSGQDSYRNISQTGENGVAEFLSLRQGEYFAKAFLKEWSFSPKNNMLEIQPGKHTDVAFKGTRVAFSAYGKLKYVNGREEAGLVVLADSPDCGNHREDATTLPDGSFQLSGLRPNCKYNLLSGTPEIERLLTSQDSVVVKDMDIKIDGDILALRRLEHVDLTILVKSGGNDLPGAAAAVDVTVTGDKGFHRVIKATPNEMAFLARSLKAGGEERYTVECCGGARKEFTPTSTYEHVVLDARDGKGGKGGEGTLAGPSAQMLLPVAIAILVIVAFRQVYQQKMQKM